MSIFLGGLLFEGVPEFDRCVEFDEWSKLDGCSKFTDEFDNAFDEELEFNGCPEFDSVPDDWLEFDIAFDNVFVGKSLSGLIHSASKPTSLLQKAKKLHLSLWLMLVKRGGWIFLPFSTILGLPRSWLFMSTIGFSMP